MFSIKTTLSVVASTTIGITAFMSHPARAADFSIKFLDPNAKEIGLGWFSADRPSDEQLDLLFDGADTSAINVGTIKHWLYINRFRATLDRFSWNSTHANFWDTENKIFKHIEFLTSGEARLLDGGIFGNADGFDDPTLVLERDDLYRLLGSKEVGQGILAIAQQDESQAQTLDAVPEASTILGSLTAIGMLTLFKRAISKKTKD